MVMWIVLEKSAFYLFISEYVDEAVLIPRNTSVLVRRVPGRPRMPIVTGVVITHDMYYLDPSNLLTTVFHLSLLKYKLICSLALLCAVSPSLLIPYLFLVGKLLRHESFCVYYHPVAQPQILSVCLIAVYGYCSAGQRSRIVVTIMILYQQRVVF